MTQAGVSTETCVCVLSELKDRGLIRIDGRSLVVLGDGYDVQPEAPLASRT